MNKILIAWLSGTAATILSARGQGTFQNLDFEAAHNLPASGFSIATTNGLPGWTAYSGTNQLSIISYNEVTAVPKVGLNHPAYISGNFDAALYGIGSISQTGLVPADAQSLLFKGASVLLSPLLLRVTVAGQSLSYMAIFTGPNYTLYGADISAFAGQTARLEFSSPSRLSSLDDIQFSSEAIPEPRVLSLFAIAALFLGCPFLKRKS